jgi:hypothetical protein
VRVHRLTVTVQAPGASPAALADAARSGVARGTGQRAPAPARGTTAGAVERAVAEAVRRAARGARP